MGRVHIHSNKLCRSAAGGRVRIDLVKMLVGYTRRLGAQRDYFIEVLADFLAVSLDGLGRVGLQQLPEFRVALCLRMDLAPVLIAQFSH